MSISQWRWRVSNSRPLGYETRPLPCRHQMRTWHLISREYAKDGRETEDTIWGQWAIYVYTILLNVIDSKEAGNPEIQQSNHAIWKLKNPFQIRSIFKFLLLNILDVQELQNQININFIFKISISDNFRSIWGDRSHFGWPNHFRDRSFTNSRGPGTFLRIFFSMMTPSPQCYNFFGMTPPPPPLYITYSRKPKKNTESLYTAGGNCCTVNRSSANWSPYCLMTWLDPQ